MISCTPALTGCAAWNAWFGNSRSDLDYLSDALEADARGREQMWKRAQAEEPSDRSVLHRALLRSVPGHSGSDSAQAQVELQTLLSSRPAGAIAAVARERLGELRATRECRMENDALRDRMSRVVDIERQIGQRRRTP